MPPQSYTLTIDSFRRGPNPRTERAMTSQSWRFLLGTVGVLIVVSLLA